MPKRRGEGDSFPIWTQAKAADLTATYGAGSGEFPVPSCSVNTSVPFASNVTKIEVMVPSRTRNQLGTVVYYTKSAAAVKAGGTSPAPDLRPSISIDANGPANAVVLNEGPVRADSVDADIAYEYDYCPTKQGDEPPSCVIVSLPQGTCEGVFCGPGTFANYLRQPIHCSWSKDFATCR